MMIRFVAAVLIALAMPSAVDVRTATQDLSKEISRAQEEAAVGLLNIAATWRSEGHSELDANRLFADLGVTAGHFQPLRQRIDFVAERKSFFTTFYSRNGKDIVSGDDRETSFDGQSVFHRIGQADIGRITPLEKLARETPKAVLFDIPYLAYAGFASKATPTTIGRAIRPLIAELLEAGAQVSSVEQLDFRGTSALVVVISSEDARRRFVIDPSMNHAVLQSETLTIRGVRLLVDNRDFTRLANSSLWLPRTCHVEWSRPSIGQSPLASEDLTVEEIHRSDSAPARFSLQFDPGTLVSDFRIPQGETSSREHITYVASASPSDFDRAALEAKPWNAGAIAVSQAWLAPGLGVAAILALLVSRSRKKRGNS